MLSDFAGTPYTSLEFNMCRTFVPTSGDVNSPVSLNPTGGSKPPDRLQPLGAETNRYCFPSEHLAYGYTSTVASLATEPELLTQENY